jgi:hypothetical protein
VNGFALVAEIPRGGLKERHGCLFWQLVFSITLYSKKSNIRTFAANKAKHVRLMSMQQLNKAKAVPLHAMKALEGEEV